MDVAVQGEIDAEVEQEGQHVAGPLGEVAVAELAAGDREQAVMQGEHPQRPGCGPAQLRGRRPRAPPIAAAGSS